MMFLGVFIGFVVAVHLAGSPRLYAAVDRLNHKLTPVLNQQPHAPLDTEALIVTADHNTELTSVATLSPRGFHPVIATGAQNALERIGADVHVWKLVVIDASLPGAAALRRALREQLPAVDFIAVPGRSGAQAVSRVLMERLSAPVRDLAN